MIRYAQKIIPTDMIELCQGNENLRRDHAFAAFVISIGSLGNIDLLANLSLCKVSVFS